MRYRQRNGRTYSFQFPRLRTQNRNCRDFLAGHCENDGKVNNLHDYIGRLGDREVAGMMFVAITGPREYIQMCIKTGTVDVIGKQFWYSAESSVKLPGGDIFDVRNNVANVASIITIGSYYRHATCDLIVSIRTPVHKPRYFVRYSRT